MTLEDYLVLIESMNAYTYEYRNTIDYNKPVLLITIIEMMDKGAARDNLFHLNSEIFKKAYQKVWDCCVDFRDTQSPSCYFSSEELENDMFWHISYRDSNDLFLDDELYKLLLVKSTRVVVLKTLLQQYFHTKYQDYLVRLLNYALLAGTIYEDGKIQPDGLILLTSRPQWEELTPFVQSVLEQQFDALKGLLTENGKKLLDETAPNAEAFYVHLLLHIEPQTSVSLAPLKQLILKTLDDIENVLAKEMNPVTCLSTMLPLSKAQLEWWEDVEDTNNLIKQVNVEQANPSLACINQSGRGILLAEDETVYETTGTVFILENEAFVLLYKDSSLSVYRIETNGKKYYTGRRIVLALISSLLYQEFNPGSTEHSVEAITLNATYTHYNIRYRGQWYNHLGDMLKEDLTTTDMDKLTTVDPIIPAGEISYVPHGRYGKLEKYTKSPYVNLLMMALADTLDRPIQEQPDTITFRELALRMIANAWEILHVHEEKRNTYPILSECIDNLITMPETPGVPRVHYYSSKELVYQSIAQIPLSTQLDETIEALMSNTPYHLLRAWIQTRVKAEILFKSHLFEDNCPYAIKLSAKGDYIEFNPRRKKMFAIEHDSLVLYYANKFKEYVLP